MAFAFTFAFTLTSTGTDSFAAFAFAFAFAFTFAPMEAPQCVYMFFSFFCHIPICMPHTVSYIL